MTAFALFSVKTYYNEIVFFINLQNFFGLLTANPRNIYGTSQTIKSVNTDERSEFGKSLNLARNDVINVNIVPEIIFLSFLFFFKNQFLRSDYSLFVAFLYFFTIFAFARFLFG